MKTSRSEEASSSRTSQSSLNNSNILSLSDHEQLQQQQHSGGQSPVHENTEDWIVLDDNLEYSSQQNIQQNSMQVVEDGDVLGSMRRSTTLEELMMANGWSAADRVSRSNQNNQTISTSQSSRPPFIRSGHRVLRRDSTRLRSNVVDQMQRDLTPAGRMLTIVVVIIEWIAEVSVLRVDWNKPCSSPLRTWVLLLMMMQFVTVALNIASMVVARNLPFGRTQSTQESSPVQSLSNSELELMTDDSRSQSELQNSRVLSRESSWTSMDDEIIQEVAAQNWVRAETLVRCVRLLNAVYLAWFVVGSVWLSDPGTCASTAPNLYRLVLALTIIYYSTLGLPLACFCLIMCCLPLFIRFMLPYAERAQRRGRSASEDQIKNLICVPFEENTFEGSGDHSCVICLSNYVKDEMISTLPCKHHFHQNCINEWLAVDKSCPLCKQDIDVTSNV
mmetsp:Transcript_10919/g.19740  ORF Transcript_10919/g.19740 Transcript_10919/m.19740 type:complete len:446 (-) Transcript_10919:387-1724(-)